MNYGKLSIAEKFGQMLLIGLDVYEINDEIIKIIKDFKIGGVVLYKKNYTSLDKMIEVINKLKHANKSNKVPLFIAIDQENGVVNRLPKDITPIYGARKQVLADANVCKVASEITTYILKEVGINMNLAPVLDLEHFADNSDSSRCYGNTKEMVLKNALPFMQFMQKNNIVSVVKHFPGTFIDKKNSHLTITSINDLPKVVKEDLAVFQEACSYGVDTLMVNHLRVKGYGRNPVSFNKKFLDDYLFKSCNYHGVVMTDDIRMGLLPFIYKTQKTVAKCIDAGNDIIMIKYRKNDYKKLYKKLFDKVKYCEIDIERINNSAKKILLLKNKYKVTNEECHPNINIEAINNHINKINAVIDKKVGVVIY